MHRCEVLHRFELDYQASLDKQIDPKPLVEVHSRVVERNDFLSFDLQPSLPQQALKHDLIHRF